MMWLALILATTTAATLCTNDKAGVCTDRDLQLTLTRSQPILKLDVYIQVGKVLDIHFPEGVELASELAVGSSKMLTTKVRERPLGIQIWANEPKGTKVEDTIGADTNVIIKLKDGIHIVLNVILSAEYSVETLGFTFPEKQKELEATEKIRAEERKKLREELSTQFAELEEKAELSSRKTNARSVMGGARIICAELSVFERKTIDLLELRGKRLCQIGDQIYLAIEIRNHARDTFLLKDMSVAFGMGEDRKVFNPICEWENNAVPQLRYKEFANGVLIFPSELNKASSFDVEVLEEGGKNRDVVLKGVGF